MSDRVISCRVREFSMKDRDIPEHLNPKDELLRLGTQYLRLKDERLRPKSEHLRLEEKIFLN